MTPVKLNQDQFAQIDRMLMYAVGPLLISCMAEKLNTSVEDVTKALDKMFHDGRPLRFVDSPTGKTVELAIGCSK